VIGCLGEPPDSLACYLHLFKFPLLYTPSHTLGAFECHCACSSSGRASLLGTSTWQGMVAQEIGA